jgi:general secretion pathway protein B
MSYILDALERAQAQRAQGQVPDLYARQSVAAALPDSATKPWRGSLALGAVATLGALVLGAWLMRPSTVEPAAPPTAMRAAEPVAVAEPLSPPARPAPRAKAPPEPAQAKTEEPTRPKPAAAPAAAPIGVPLLGELPEDIRRQIPTLTVNGAVYSDNPGQRLLLVNGQVLSQGSAVAPDVTLEIIQPASSEFSFKGMRFRVAH